LNKNKWKAIVWLIVLPFFFIPFGRGQNSKFDFTALDKENEEIEINPQDPWKREEVITPQELVDALRKSSKKKDPSGRLLRNAILNSYIEFNQKSRFKDIKPIIDIDPQSII